MMEEWGVPTFYIQALTYEFCQKLAAKGEYVPDIAIAGGFSSEDHIFKVLAMGAPYTKAVCMGRALMIPGMVGKNIGKWIKANDLPKSVSEAIMAEDEHQLFEKIDDLTKMPVTEKTLNEDFPVSVDAIDY